MNVQKSEKRFFFWQQWLFYSSLLFALFGLVLAVWGDNPLFEPYNRLLARKIWNQPEFPSPANDFRALALGPLGGTIACSYLLLAFLARFPFRNKERWARNAIVIAFGLWFLIDSTVCVYYEIYFQAFVINGISLLQKALPLIFTWKNFRKKVVE
jgi:hypothetical protein